MRVLHVLATDRRRGAETFAGDLMRALDGAGISQMAVVLRPGGPYGAELPASTRFLSDGRPPAFVSRSLQLARIVRSFRPDVVQAHGGEAFKHAVAVSGAGGRPVVYRRIGGAPPWLLTQPRRSGWRWIVGRAARVVTVAEALRREAIELFRLPSDRVVTIQNAVDQQRLGGSGNGRDGIRAQLGIPESAPVLLSLGAVAWEKNPEAHLAVSEHVLGRIPQAIHLIVGDGPLRGRLEVAARNRGLGERVVFAGSRSDVGSVIRSADVLLFASRARGMEGMPAAVIEAGMCGVPVAGFDVAGVAEVVVDGQTGFLADAGDVDGLAERAATLLAGPDLRRDMGGRARGRCRELFDISVVAPRYLALYREVTGTR